MFVAACCLAVAAWVALAAGAQASGPLGPSDRPEAYFNGSSFIRINRPISLKQLVGLSFRTCVGEGKLFLTYFMQLAFNLRHLMGDRSRSCNYQIMYFVIVISLMQANDSFRCH